MAMRDCVGEAMLKWGSWLERVTTKMDLAAASKASPLGDIILQYVHRQRALNALGIAGTVGGASFVILDFIDHTWVGGAIGAVGRAAGITAGALVAGPLGWITGGAITALFGSKLSPATL